MDTPMTVVSVNVGTPQRVRVSDGMVLTSIFKSPVATRVAVLTNNISGDRQADLSVHGGPYKAVYCYPEEHYQFWRGQLADIELVPGIFGENLTTRGLTEEAVNIGDRFRVGSVVLQVTQPRMPCYKLGIRFGRKDILRRFLQSRRSGFYLAVTKTGDLAADDDVELLARDENKVSVTDIVRVWVEDKGDVDTMKRALNIGSLPETWKEPFRDRIEKALS